MAHKLPYDKMLLVEWMDAASNDGWVSPEDDTSPETIVTIGWLIKDTDVYITLANSIHKNVDHQVGGTMTIPKGMITKQQEVKVTNARSKPRHKLHTEPASKEVHRKPGEG